jgi:hypothetical protein
MNRFLYAVRPTLDILGDTIAILLDRELERPWDQIFAENKGEWKKKVLHRINKRRICNSERKKGKCKEK